MSRFTRRALALGIAALPAVAHAKARRVTLGPRVQFWATASGGETLDGPNGSGNPFATALIETMANPALDFAGACTAIAQRTAALSNGFQAVEAVGADRASAWRFSPGGLT